MLDINFVRENPRLIKENEKRRDRDAKAVDEILTLDDNWKKQLKRVEELKHTRNVVSQDINKLKKEGKNIKPKIKEMQQVVDDIKKGEEKVEELLQRRDQLLKSLGNIIHPLVPKGKDASENVEIKKWGKTPKFTFPIKNHVELCETLHLADFDASARVSGNGFYYLKNELGFLNQALLHFAVDFMRSKGYDYIEPPLLIKKDVLGAAIDTKEWQNTIYSIEGEDLALIGTSEHALLGLHAQEALLDKDLPKKYFSYSMCFRKEVGSHGINEKGTWRTHQFNKVEQFIFCSPEDSEKYFNELLNNSEEILQALGLPYRVIDICTGDLSLWKNRSYDLEVWRPTTQAYGEVMSLSNCTDYQARKLGIKVVGPDNKRRVLHTLNNTALATSRIMVAILENFQTKQGTIKVPKVLWPYMNGITEIGKK